MAALVGLALTLGVAEALAHAVIERGPWSGAVTPQTFTVKAKLSHTGAVARLLASVDPDFRTPLWSAPQTAEADRNRVVSLSMAGLHPNTQYYYALQIQGRLDLARRGAVRTFPSGPASFTFAFGSCARTGSSHAVFDRIREQRPLFFLHLGDLHYLDITNNDSALYRAAFDRVLGAPAQALLYRFVPMAYVWDDHDFAGNSSTRFAASQEAARRTYQEYVPHYPLPAGSGNVPIYQAFTVGRVRFLLTDLRSERDPGVQPDNSGKSMLGLQQKAWFKQQLLEAKDKYPLIFWGSSVPWLGEPGRNYYPVPTTATGYLHHTNLTTHFGTNQPGVPIAQAAQDHWCIYSSERAELANFIAENGIRGVCILHGDSHMLAADDGQHGDYATGGGAALPVLCAGVLDQNPSHKGGPYSQGVYRVAPGESGYGLVTVTDQVEEIAVQFVGRNHRNEPKIGLTFRVKAARQ